MRSGRRTLTASHRTLEASCRDNIGGLQIPVEDVLVEAAESTGSAPDKENGSDSTVYYPPES